MWGLSRLGWSYVWAICAYSVLSTVVYFGYKSIGVMAAQPKTKVLRKATPEDFK